MRPFFLLLAVVAVLPHAAAAQRVRGYVLDDSTERSVPGAVVTLLDGSDKPHGRALTDSAGGFEFPSLEPGRYFIRGERAGYATVTAPALDLRMDDTMVVELRMMERAVSLAPLTVRAFSRTYAHDRDLDTFYERQRMGGGTFFGPRELAMYRNLNAAQLVEMVNGVDVRYSRGEAYVSMRTIARRCGPPVFVDGMRLSLDIASRIPNHDIAAVEVYTRPTQVPPHLMSLSEPCGAIVIWTQFNRPRRR